MRHSWLFLGAFTLLLTACAKPMPTYQDPVGKSYSVRPPQGWIAHRSKELNYADAVMHGVSFTAPVTVGKGTVLNEASIDVANGDQTACPQTGSAALMGGEQARRWEWSDVGAGNLYQGTVVSAVHGGMCYRLTLFTHSCNLGPDCSLGHTASFDRKSLFPVFDDVVSSFRFSR